MSKIARQEPNCSPAVASPHPQTGGYAHSPDEQTRLRRLARRSDWGTPPNELRISRRERAA